MKFLKLSFISIILFFIINGTAFSSYSDIELKLYYDKLYSKVETKYHNNEDNIIDFLEKVDLKLEDFLEKIESRNNKKQIRYLMSLNRSKIDTIVFKNYSSNQPDFLDILKRKGYDYIRTNDKLECYKRGWFKLSFDKYYELNENNYKIFLTDFKKNSIITKYKNKYILIENFKKERKYSFKELETIFSNFYDEKNKFYFEKDGYYYFYKYSKYIFFNSKEGIYLSDLKNNGIILGKSLFIKDGDRYYFSLNFEEVRLCPISLLKGIKNKEIFIRNIIDDTKFVNSNNEQILREIKNLTNELIEGKNTDSDKILAIYKWVISHLNYYQNYADGTKDIFSGLMTFKNKIGVCDGYAKLALYMLSFAGVKNVEIKRGYAYDAIDFPDFGHAWLRIGQKYYDPTYDNYIKIVKDKEELSYFAVPKKLLYVNRFDGLTIPKSIKGKTLEERKSITLKNMYDIYNEYNNYLSMRIIKNRILLGLNYNQDLKVSDLQKIMKTYEANYNNYYIDNGKIVKIKSLKYIPVNNSNINNVLSEINLNLDDMVLLKWNKSNGNFEYRICYEIVTY